MRLLELCLAVVVVAVGCCGDTTQLRADLDEVYAAAFRGVLDKLDEAHVGDEVCVAINNDATEPRFHALSADTLARVADARPRPVDLRECRIDYSEQGSLQSVHLRGERVWLVYSITLSWKSSSRSQMIVTAWHSGTSSMSFDVRLELGHRGWSSVSTRVISRT